MMLKEPVIRYLENQNVPKYVDSSWNIDVLFTRQKSKSEMLDGNNLKCCNMQHSIIWNRPACVYKFTSHSHIELFQDENK